MGMRLVDGLRAENNSRIAFVGAGGKTSAMFRLARQLATPVICMNTTHLALDQARLADQHFIVTNPADLASIFNQPISGIVLLTGPETDRQRLSGLTDLLVEKIQIYADQLGVPLLVEADGARQLPLKAPALHEPPIPQWVNHVVYLVGLTGLNQPLDEAHVFRSELFGQLSEIKVGDPVGVGAIEKFLVNPDGGLKNIPGTARKTIYFNQWDVLNNQDFWPGSEMNLVKKAYDTILIGSVQAQFDQVTYRYENIAGIILAAGGGVRMGRTKQLLEWHGKPMVRHIAEKAFYSGMNPVQVVTGFDAQKVAEALKGLPVQIIFNPGWESGQASSIRTGVENLPDGVGAAVFLLSDMPGIPVAILREEIKIHQNESLSILCPRIGSQRVNPVLFDRRTFNDLTNLTGDAGGRQMFDRYPIRWLDWNEPAAFLDVDTPEDYQSLLEKDVDDEK